MSGRKRTHATPTRERQASDALTAGFTGAETDPASYYAADAAKVLLDAIAVSDGSRSSVRRAVRETQLRDGMFGPVGFDSHGDIRQPAISLLQVKVSDHSRQDFPRTRLFEVMHPPRALISP